VNVDVLVASRVGGFATLCRAAGLADARPGDRVTTVLPGLPPLDAEVDYVAAHFLGLRTDDALYRVFGRDAFGAPVSVVAHLFAPDADTAAVEAALRAWLDDVFA